MPWVTGWDNIKGPYAGRSIPQSWNIQEMAEDAVVVGDLISIDVQDTAYWWEQPRIPEWAGAFGLPMGKLWSITPTDGTHKQFKLFEIPIKNPDGAQYYRQTLNVFAETYCNVRQIDWDCVQFEYHIVISRVSRLVYATPYDDNPTETWTRPLSATNMYMEIEGDWKLNEWASYAEYIGATVITIGTTNYLIFYTYTTAQSWAIDPQAVHQERIPQYKMLFSGQGFELATFIEEFGQFEPEEGEEDPNAPVPPDEPTPPYDPGGGGDKEDPNDIIPIPNIPDIDPHLAGGFFHVFSMDENQIYEFGQIFNDYSFYSAVKQFLNNYKDCIIGINFMPFTPTLGAYKRMQWGWSDTGLTQYTCPYSFPLVAKQYKKIDMGEIYVKPYWRNCFDYSPYTKITIWLPYIGFKDIPVDEIMENYLHVAYICDCFTGDCVAFLSRKAMRKIDPGWTGPVGEQVFACYYGNVGVQTPTTATSFDGLISAGIQLMGVAASQGLQAAGGGALLTKKPDDNGAISSLIGSTVNAVQSMKPTYSKGGGAGASDGYMSIQYPYIIIEHPNQSLPTDYNKFRGYPFNESGTLGQLKTGFAVVDDIQLNNIPAFETEREEIKRLLREGVLL